MSGKNIDGMLNGTRVYLCGSMEYENGEAWRNNISIHLNKMGIKVLNPYDSPFLNSPVETEISQKFLREQIKKANFSYVHDYMKKIRRFDLACVDRSDFIIVYINPKIPSWGSAEELSVALRSKKPVFIFVEGGRENCPLWVMGMLPSHYIYNSPEEIVCVLNGIHSGFKEIDSERWRLLKPSFR